MLGLFELVWSPLTSAYYDCSLVQVMIIFNDQAIVFLFGNILTFNVLLFRQRSLLPPFESAEMRALGESLTR